MCTKHMNCAPYTLEQTEMSISGYQWYIKFEIPWNASNISAENSGILLL